MSIVRKKIRNMTVSLLTGKTLAGDRVYPSRIIPIQTEALPQINVYTTNEIVEDSGEAPLLNKRMLTVICEIITDNALADGIATDQADDIAEQIERILFLEDANSCGKLGMLVDKIRLQSLSLEYESPGESAINACRLSFAMTYMKEAVTTLPDNLNDLERMGVDWDVGTANDPDPEATDLIEFPP